MNNMFRKYILSTVLLWLCTILTVIAQEKRDLLTNNCNKTSLKEHLLPGLEWAGLPAYTNRQKWDNLSPVYKAALIKSGENALSYKWQLIPATEYLAYVRTGNRTGMQQIYTANTSNLKRLVLAELAEGKGRFTDQIINGVWAMCEMTTWSLSAHLSAQKKGLGIPDITDPIIDLEVGNTAALLAWIHYFFHDTFDKVNSLVAARIRYEIDRQVLTPYYQRDDFWWMAFKKDDFVNNWNVWINYNVLNCILLMETDPEKRAAGVYKTMQSVDKFINYYKADGGCEEGPAYWESAGGMLYEYLALLSEATNGKVNQFDNELVKNIGRYIYRAYINDRYYINFADAAAKLNQPPGLIYCFGKAIGDEAMKGFGSFLAHKQRWDTHVPQETLQATVANLWLAKAILDYPQAEPLLGDFWLPGTQILAARDKAGTTQGFYFAAKGGHNNESHNHNDVGSFMLYYNGKPVLIDIGSEVYTRQTFGPERYTIWTMRSVYHNLPLINGVEQHAGQQFAARQPVFKATPGTVSFTLDIAKAYPDTAGVNKWNRSYLLKRGTAFTITDDYHLTRNNGNTAIHFMSSIKPTIVKPGVLRLGDDEMALDMLYAGNIPPVIEDIPVKDERLLQSWPPHVYRIIFKLPAGSLTGKNNFKIIPAK
jgi:hypothetical protein